MNFVKKITFSTKISLVLYGLSFLLFGYSIASVATFEQANLWIFTFVLGAFAVYPIINYSWGDVRKNWIDSSEGDFGYRELFTEDLDKERKREIIKGHWKNTWWIVPYVFTVYLYVSYMVSLLFGYRALLPMLAGSIFSIGLTSYEYQKTFDM